jgi:hypothetical protein
MAEPNSTTSGSTIVTEDTNKETPATKPATESDATTPASAPNVEEPAKHASDDSLKASVYHHSLKLLGEE